ncbi:unnamed protein product, partial [Hydatigera taeniaeformis]|uniref:Protein-tyrosine-phosphatase n=1 Tax=Hydatigena taeniaeformis TaxID=6205 RepID=A0A0R3WLI8_HYDTA
CFEGGKEKCAQYWPEGSAQTFNSKKRSVEVWKESEGSSGSVIRRQLKIRPSGEASPWTVTQFQFTGWGHNDLPDMESFYNLVVIQNNILATHSVGYGFGPTVVHCSDGVGPTGTFMVACFLLDRLRMNPQSVDIIGTILATQKWRANLAQTWSQLQFLYNFVDFCIDRENIGTRSLAPSTRIMPYEAPVEYDSPVDPFQSNAVE